MISRRGFGFLNFLSFLNLLKLLNLLNNRGGIFDRIRRSRAPGSMSGPMGGPMIRSLCGNRKLLLPDLRIRHPEIGRTYPGLRLLGQRVGRGDLFLSRGRLRLRSRNPCPPGGRRMGSL